MDQNNSITLTYTWTLDDAKDHDKALFFRQFKLARKTWLPIVLIAVAIIGFAIQSDLSLIIPALLPVIIIAIPFWFIFTHAQKKAFKEGPYGNRTILVTINSDEITMKSGDNREGRWKWTAIVEVMRTNKGFLFFEAPQVGFWIPIRAFQSESDINSVLELAKHLTPKVSTMTI